MSEQLNLTNEQETQYNRKNRLLLMIFIGGLCGFIVLVASRPTLENPHVFDNISFPPTPQDLFNLSQILVRYMDEHLLYTIFAYVYLYVLLQAFAIPGPIFLCLLSPTLFGALNGFCLCITCSCLGASLCYLMSLTLARQLVLRRFPTLFRKFNSMVSQHHDKIFWYMLFLRLTPLIPNWFVNLGSPLVGIPYRHFLFGSMFGMMPMNLILIETGKTLREIETIGIKPKHFIILLILGGLSLIPTFIGRKYEDKISDNEQLAKERLS